MTKDHWICFALLVACCFAAAAGCDRSGGGVVVKGTLLDGGQPAVFTQDSHEYELQFFPLDDAGDFAKAPSYRTNVDNKDGTFQVRDLAGRKGIPPGKYRVAIYRMYDSRDVWQGKFGQRTSPFTVEVKPGEPVTIELKGAKPTGPAGPT